MTPAIDTRRRNARQRLEQIEHDIAELEAQRREAVRLGHRTTIFYRLIHERERERRMLEGWVL